MDISDIVIILWQVAALFVQPRTAFICLEKAKLETRWELFLLHNYLPPVDDKMY